MTRLACITLQTPDQVAHAALQQTLNELSDRVQTLAAGRFLIDTDPFGTDTQAQAVLNEALGPFMPAGIGIAHNRFGSEQAALAGAVVPEGTEAAFLAPLPVGRLPLTREAERRLLLLNLRTLGDLATLPRAAVVSQFGREAELWYELARGSDPRPLRPDPAPPTVERSVTLADASNYQPFLQARVAALAADVAAGLARGGYQAETLQLTLTLDNAVSTTVEHIVKPPTADEARLRRLAERLLERTNVVTEVSRLELAAVSVRSWHHGVVQPALFGGEIQRGIQAQRRHLDETVRGLRQRFGARSVVWATELEGPAPVPVRVTTNERGVPAVVRLAEQVRRVRDLIEHWQEEYGWGAAEIRRNYFEVVLEDSGSLRTLFCDMLSGGWYLERTLL